MKEYTAKEIKLLKENPYTFNVTKHKLYHTAKFKEDFWIRYQAGDAPKKILKDLGYDVRMFGRKRIDSMVQRIKKQALSGTGFLEGENRNRRIPMKALDTELTYKSFERMQTELLYLRQEVEFLKKIIKTGNTRTGG